MRRTTSLALACVCAATGCIQDSLSHAQPAPPRLRDIYEELVEINTVTETGDTARAADAMAAHLLAAGFDPADIHIIKPAPRKGNLVARLRGNGTRRPLMLMAHLDVVEARREDWSTDPFQLVEQAGFYYARGSHDDKAMAAIFLANMIRMKREGLPLERDLILVLETDEEILDGKGHGIQWLLNHHRDLIDAELALNEGGTVGAVDGQGVFVAIEVWQRRFANFIFEVRNRGGHSSQPRVDNAIYELAHALTKVEAHKFPLVLNDVTRGSIESFATIQPEPLASDLRAIAAGTADETSVARVTSDPTLNATLRTTCVATLLEAGHAFNALPQLARATVNCRILPTETPEATLAALRDVVADERVSITQAEAIVASEPSAFPPPLQQSFERIRDHYWPDAVLFPIMTPGATDGAFLRNAGIPTYGIGLLEELGEQRAHGRDERIAVSSFESGEQWIYDLIVQLAAAP